jgi:hypothetical protein
MAKVRKGWDHYLILSLSTVIILAIFLFVFTRSVKKEAPRSNASACTYCSWSGYRCASKGQYGCTKSEGCRIRCVDRCIVLTSMCCEGKTRCSGTNLNCTGGINYVKVQKCINGSWSTIDNCQEHGSGACCAVFQGVASCAKG